MVSASAAGLVLWCVVASDGCVCPTWRGTAAPGEVPLALIAPADSEKKIELFCSPFLFSTPE